MTVKRKRISTKRKSEKYYGKHYRYSFPVYEPHAFRTKEEASGQYKSLADQHRIYAAGYLNAAIKREKEKGKSDRLAKQWRKMAAKDHSIAQRADNEALRLS